MLTELKNVLQRPKGLRRRWFQSRNEDLIVWYSRNGHICGFQFCYAGHRGERALTWKAGKGFSHHRVDDGEDDPLTYKRTPILVPNGAVYPKAVRARFDAISLRLPRTVAFLVRKKLLEL